ncbi:hypothetical protein MLD38_035112 [Melastoma candidum]|uniref:Uncharacterized protein n=1 Tax=Melastoma candidum TaxID=119954 RepID=A0ACB9MF98_9MYRT|nr:hypothetical protein MLD38_035112 [Melastoma candidum]
MSVEGCAAAEILGRVESKSRRRSMSSFSGYLDDLSHEHTSSSGQFPQGSTLSASEECTREKTGSIYKSKRGGGWMAAWRWSRIRRNYRKRTVAVVSRRQSTSKQISTAGNVTDEAVATSGDHSNKEIKHVDLGKCVVSGAQMDELIVRYASEQSSRDRIRRNAKEKYSAASLSLKYQPKCFQDIVGHETIIRVMINTIQKNKVVSLYLFHGPIGTGKSSTARILTMALNCEADPDSRPCWNCRECLRSLYVMDMCSGSRSSGFEKIKTLIQSTSFTHTLVGYKVFIIEECHLLTPEAWDELLGIIEGSYSSSIVFILITMDIDVLPVTVSSRCQKYCFPKLKDSDVKNKLERIAVQEGISIEPGAMQLITAKADGSLREAENILDQLTLLGTRITTPIVQEINESNKAARRNKCKALRDYIVQIDGMADYLAGLHEVLLSMAEEEASRAEEANEDPLPFFTFGPPRGDQDTSFDDTPPEGDGEDDCWSDGSRGFFEARSSEDHGSSSE